MFHDVKIHVLEYVRGMNHQIEVDLESKVGMAPGSH